MSLFPIHLQIEVVAGLCSADCIMCNIKAIQDKGILDMKSYRAILDKFASHTNRLKYLTLHCRGEPLLDNSLPQKVEIARDLGFPSIGFATNATHLNQAMAKALLQNGLNTIIVSIDGIRKETHEKIRRGVNYDQVLRNVLDFIKLRNENYNAKVIMRMIRQKENQNEWNEYREFWQSRLDPEYGDQVSVFDIHNWGGREDSNAAERATRFKRLQELSQKTKMICHDLEERMVVYWNGDIGLCSGEEHASHNLGNIFRDEPETIFNGPVYTEYRRLMRDGRLAEIDYCKNCQVILSRMERQYLGV